MGSRIAAGVIVLAGLGALIWVGLGGSSTESVTAPTPAPTAPTVNLAEPAASAENETTSNDGAATDTTSASEAIEASATAESPTAATQIPTAVPEPAADAPENLGPRMDLVEIDGWLNTDATSIDDFNGKVVLVEMWTFGCFNCKARIPFTQSYYEEFKDENFEIIGVHAPEFSYEADVVNIQNAIVDLGVTWPVALDTEKKNFRAWQSGSRNFWPRTYVIDQNGDIRYDHIGEGRYEELREVIRYLVENPPAPTAET